MSVSDRWGNGILQGTCAINGETGTLSYQDMSLMTYTQSQYDNANRLLSTSDNAGLSTSFQYDAMGRTLKETVSKDGSSRVSSYTYDQAGNKLTETGPDGTITSYTYDKLNRVLTTKISKGSDSLTTNAVAYDAVESGLLKMSFTDAMGRTGSKYVNVLGDLVKEVTGGKTTEYRYDSATGNMTESKLSDPVFSGSS